MQEFRLSESGMWVSFANSVKFGAVRLHAAESLSLR